MYDDDIDTMTTAEVWQERWQAYKKPIKILLVGVLIGQLFSPDIACSVRYCPLPEEISTLQYMVFMFGMSYSFIFPIWIYCIWLKRKYEADGHLD
ncbi:hypothetical protein LNQ82_02085 [Conchiformibius steedae DSM 2580]|uniref:Uncharacterized protein n=2 Tax=Conchiformibius steedae TaxID=153493 RepID=A0A3P2A7A1_9NEIS|nr:hypothetical protein [Conchiformibius steedae]QMT33332.1 hypothetical protein H3L98_09620 [Conchiformibius steedae]RRD90766.1 hypothetical protein EII21_03925 [Conchiformibius steedae]URD67976.1 hypothetical protein LNQ82_02085 [Conchiformibius steedae DSM 2580]